MSAADKLKLDNLPALGGINKITVEQPLLGGVITNEGTISLPNATPTAAGAMSAIDKDKLNKVGSNGFGTKFVSTSPPTGGSNGDIWYVV
jgi:hypothetical protein